MRIVIDTKKIAKPVAGFFNRTGAKVQQLRLERCARILAKVEVKKAEAIIVAQTNRVAKARAAAKKKSRKTKG